MMLDMNLTAAAQANVDETGIKPSCDVDSIRAGVHTEASLLDVCLDGADADRVSGWHEYVAAVVEEARK